MLDCYNEVDPSQFANGQGSSNVCVAQREKVKDIVRSNELNMSRLVSERIDILRSMEQGRSRTIVFDNQVNLLK